MCAALHCIALHVCMTAQICCGILCTPCSFQGHKVMFDACPDWICCSANQNCYIDHVPQYASPKHAGVEQCNVLAQWSSLAQVRPSKLWQSVKLRQGLGLTMAQILVKSYTCAQVLHSVMQGSVSCSVMHKKAGPNSNSYFMN